jgi:D-glycero-alpha-D-manno-heptose-7-phosphate kinase
MSILTPPIIRSRAPLRISFGGGGTDVAPYCDERGGLVLNATINRYAYVTIIPNDTGIIRLRSLDYNHEVIYSAEAKVPAFDFQMDLAKGVIKRLADGHSQGFDLFTHTDCPPGSGLGASSTMMVALIGAFNAWLDLGMDAYHIAQLAFDIEREDLGIKGGKQDQYCAAFGGFNFMEFGKDVVRVNPLAISDVWVSELEYSLVLAYTGTSRESSKIIATQMDNFARKDATSTAAMDRTRQMAIDMKEELVNGRFSNFGTLLHEAWQAKKGMSDNISNPHIDRLYEAARNAGALGGKISGAGGGGFMYFFTDFDKRRDVEEALHAEGAEIVHFGFSHHGVQTWIR